jgi:hypothetical protein
MPEQWNPETTDPRPAVAPLRHNLEWRLAFCDRLGSADVSRMSSALRRTF